MRTLGGSSLTVRDELLTEQFYTWERRGRGWQVWDFPVELEPPYRPFFGHFLPSHLIREDDGHQPTLWSSLAHRLRLSIGGATPTPQDNDGDFWIELAEQEPDVEPYLEDEPVAEVQVALPQRISVTKALMEQVVASVADVTGPLAFEIVGSGSTTIVQFACTVSDRSRVRQALSAYFPDAVLSDQPGFLAAQWNPSKRIVVADFGLSNEFMRPLREFDRFDPDPLAGMVAAVSDTDDGETGIYQVLFTPVRYDWARSVICAVGDGQGGPFFADDAEMLKLAARKTTQPLFATIVRVAAFADSDARAWAIVRGIGASLGPFADPMSNELVPLANDGYDDLAHSRDLVLRQSRRSGMILNLGELLSIAHLPSSSVRSEKLKRDDRKTKAAPAQAIGHSVILGENRHNGKSVQVSMSADVRMRHMHVIGASGTGKSTLLTQLIMQDIDHGEGVAVLDPHGDLIDDILGRIPDSRLDDVVLVDPSDVEHPVGFNILQAHSELEKTLLGSDLVAAFRRLSTSWGDQMNSVLGNAILAFLESDEGGTVADLRRFLVEADFRARFLSTVRDPEVVYYWQKEFPLLSGRPQAPILTRLDAFLRPKLVRNMVSQRVNRFDIGTVMNEGKILLVKLAQGAIGEENAYLLGTFVVSKIYQMAIARQELSKSNRRSFFCYIDEFHNFVTPSMASILSGARKYRLGLVLAHQDLRQLNRNEDVASAVLGNPSTRVCFRVGDADAKRLAEGFTTFTAQDIQSLGVGEAVCRMERADWDFNLKVPPPLPVLPDGAARREQVVARSRERYAGTPEMYGQPQAPTPASAEGEHASVRSEAPLFNPSAAVSPAEPDRPRQESVSASRPDNPRPLAGRGGAQHKYLQQLIAKWAEAHGWRVTIEKPVLDGLGCVDVALERSGQTVACEISVTTEIEHEMGNIQKCLAAGFSNVLFVSGTKKTLDGVTSKLREAISETDQARVGCCTPEDVFVRLEQLDVREGRATKSVRGYKVTVSHRGQPEASDASRRQTVAGIVMQGLKKLNTKK